jgi:hypothetical protein
MMLFFNVKEMALTSKGNGGHPCKSDDAGRNVIASCSCEARTTEPLLQAEYLKSL